MTKTRSGKAIKELDARVDGIGEQLQRQLNELRMSVKNNNADDSGGLNGSDVMEKLGTFEKYVQRVLNELRNELDGLKMDVAKQYDHLKKQQFRKRLVIHGLKQSGKEENIYAEVCNVLCSKLKADITIKDLTACYRFGRNGNKSARPVVVDFVHEWRRDCIFREKKKLKGSRIVITEMLVPAKRKLLKEVASRLGREKCWTWQGNVYAAFENGIRQIKDVTEISDL